jgi:LmbE family N-acetylglucosaminyl deacetylase
MTRVRKREQEQAAARGEYSFVIQLDYPSSALKKPGENKLEEELSGLLSAAKPPVVYTHNPADKHETHTGTAIAVIKAIRKLPLKDRPKAVYGCEAWRDLDWMCDEDKIALEVSDEENLGKELVEIFDSQISGGKRFDLATIGRRRANATFFQSHEADKSSQVLFAMDLSPLIREDSPDISDYVLEHIKRFQMDVETKLKNHLGR